MVNQVGRLLGDPLVGLLARGADHLLGLFLPLGSRAFGIGEQRGRVGPGRPRPRAVGDRTLEHRQGLKRGVRLELAAVKAGPLSRVAGRTGRLHERDERVTVAVVADRLPRLGVAGGRPLVPQLLARAAEEMDLARLARASQRLGVHVSKRQYLAGEPVLDDARNEPALIEYDLGVVHEPEFRRPVSRAVRSAVARAPRRWAPGRSRTNTASRCASRRRARRT